MFNDLWLFPQCFKLIGEISVGLKYYWRSFFSVVPWEYRLSLEFQASLPPPQAWLEMRFPDSRVTTGISPQATLSFLATHLGLPDQGICLFPCLFGMITADFWTPMKPELISSKSSFFPGLGACAVVRSFREFSKPQRQEKRSEGLGSKLHSLALQVVFLGRLLLTGFLCFYLQNEDDITHIPLPNHQDEIEWYIRQPWHSRK